MGMEKGMVQILIVEDDNIIAMELEERLRGLEYKVCGVSSSGQDAIAQAHRLRPDLVLMDIRLRGAMDGVEAAAEIRSQLDIPVIYLTAYADKSTLQRAKVTEPYGYILKPFEERELNTAVEMAIYKHLMERRLKESERWLAAILRSIGDAVVATDEAGSISFMNPVAETLTGWAQRDALGKRVAEVFRVTSSVEHLSFEDAITKVLREGATINLEERLLLASDGRIMPIDDSLAPIVDGRGNVRGVVLVFRDITERKRAEEENERLQAQLFQAQRMEAVGVLAGGIAHDFNNLLTTVIGSSSLMLEGLSEGEPLRRGLERIKRAGDRGASLTHQILALSRKQVPELRVLDLNAVVIDLEEMLERLIGEDTDVINTLKPGFRHVKADPVQIEQVIMNLVINAHEAMPEGGKLSIVTETVTLDQDQCRHMSGAYPGTFVRLSVIDTGSGIDPETMPHIFEPFFSTKEKGSGLGLAIADGIVKQYSGWIDVNSELGQGTTFQVYLPALSEDSVDEIAEAVPEQVLPGKGERILLVEDDDGVRAAIAEMLRANGYIAVEAQNAEKALDLFEGEGGHFDLVFSDVVLPDRDGLELVDLCLVRDPDLRVVLTSGYTDHRSQWTSIRERGFGFLRKPFDLPSLLATIRESLDAGQPGKPSPV
jgi:two-component system cell cycle sensor histidine kinase/response regulator CckA